MKVFVLFFRVYDAETCTNVSHFAGVYARECDAETYGETVVASDGEFAAEARTDDGYVVGYEVQGVTVQ